MPIFLISWPAICPIRHLVTVYSSWEYGISYCMAQHWLHLYWWPLERARSEQTMLSGLSSAPRSQWRSESNVHPPHPHWAKGRNDHLFVLCEHSRHARRHHCAAEMYRSLDGRSSFPNTNIPLYSQSEPANNICNTSSQYFLLVIWQFSHKFVII